MLLKFGLFAQNLQKLKVVQLNATRIDKRIQNFIVIHGNRREPLIVIKIVGACSVVYNLLQFCPIFLVYLVEAKIITIYKVCIYITDNVTTK